MMGIGPMAECEVKIVENPTWLGKQSPCPDGPNEGRLGYSYIYHLTALVPLNSFSMNELPFAFHILYIILKVINYRELSLCLLLISGMHDCHIIKKTLHCLY